MNAPSSFGPKLTPSEDRAYKFILAYLAEHEGCSPSGLEIAAALQVSHTRAKDLIHRLAVKKMIERPPGAQRAIRIPGLQAELRRLGFVVNPDGETLELPGLPQGQLPRLPDLVHLPDDF